jgi:hypothetical protein
VPARAVQQHGGMYPLEQGGAKAVEESLHRPRAHLSEHEGKGLPSSHPTAR